MAMTAEGKLAMMILAANGGSMDRNDLWREFQRVKAMNAEELERWKAIVAPLILAHAERRRGHYDFL